MFALVLKSFLKSKICHWCALILLTTGILSIAIGKQYLRKQQNSITAAQNFQKQSIQDNVNYHGDDLGLLLYYLRFTLIKKQDNLSAISFGQSDVNPILQSVTIRGLEGQKYDTDFENPALLLSGNLDLSFVIIYLFPLVLIALSFNLYSEEKELGTWPIIATQTQKTWLFLGCKMAVRVLFLIALLIILLSIAVLVLQLKVSPVFWAIALQGLLYLLFWGAGCFLVITLKKETSFNALLLIASWVILAILLPAIINTYVLRNFTINEALQNMLVQRDGYHKKWDLDKSAAMVPFLEEYPQYANLPVPQDTFSWLWYYAMQHNGDLEAKQSSLTTTKKIILRHTKSKNLARFIPTLNTQLNFNAFAGTSVLDHLDYLKALTLYHKNLREHFYPKIFANLTAKEINWEKFEAKFYTQKRSISWFTAFTPSFVLLFILFGAIYYRVKN